MQAADPLPVWHRLWRRLPAGPRRRLLTSFGAFLPLRIDREPVSVPDGIAVVGELSRSSGLGEGARLMLRALERLNIPHWAIDIGGALPAHVADLPSVQQTPSANAALVVHVNPPLLPFVLMGLPRSLRRGRRIIGYWSWELPTVPASWRTGSRFVHEVWAPSEFTARALEDVVPHRVQLVPHPVALGLITPSRLDRADFGLSRDAVVTLVSFNLASSFERKNPLAAIAAFRAAFGDRQDRVLLLKVGNPGHFSDDMRRITDAIAGASNIRLETRVLPPGDLLALTAQCDIVLSMHRSEGFGLVLAEAMLLGKPVVATNWSGNLQFMDHSSSALIGYDLVQSHDPRGVYSGSVWAEPNVAEAAAQLRLLAANAELRQALGMRGRDYAAVRLGGDGLAGALARIGLVGASPARASVPQAACSTGASSG